MKIFTSVKDFFKKITIFLFSVFYKKFISFLPNVLFNKLQTLLQLLLRMHDQVESKEVLNKVKIDNIEFHIYNTSGKGGLHRMAHGGEVAEYGLVKCLQSIFEFEENPIFMDIGSCKGYYAIYISKYLNNNSVVYAVESNPEYCEQIKKTITYNRCKNIKLFNKVLSNKKKKVSILGLSVIDEKEISSEDKYLSIKEASLKFENYKPGLYKETSTLDSLINSLDIKPNILKIDVHGSEGPLLEGSLNCLKNNISYILLELHSNLLLQRHSPGFTRKDILIFLLNNNFNCALIAPFNITHPTSNAIVDEDIYFEKTGKCQFLKVNEKNIDAVLFYRSLETFILATNKEIEISNLSIFKKN